MPDRMYTSGDIARCLDANVNRVRYLLATRDIRPIGRAGMVRLYAESAIEAVARELTPAKAASPRVATE